MTCARRPPPSSRAISPLTTMTSACARTEKRRKPDERKAEESEADVLEERRQRRIGYESPVEVARIAQELEFVTVKSVAAVGEDVDERDGGGDEEKNWPRVGRL